MKQLDTTVCKDDIDRSVCQMKKKQGLCSSFGFASYCRQSCGICSSDCFDEWSTLVCKGFKDFGLCGLRSIKKKCRKTCGLCDSKSSKLALNTPDNRGPNFMRTLRGQWLEPLAKEARHVNITARTLRVEGFGSFLADSVLGPVTYVVRQTPGDTRGCLPRYLCAKFNRKSMPVLTYKLSQSVLTFKDKRDVCQAGQFGDDPQPLGETFRSKYMKNLISRNPKFLKDTTLCGFGGNFTLNLTIQSTGSKTKRTCVGNFTDNQNCKDLKRIESSIVCQGGSPRHFNSQCLATWRSTSNSSRFLITTPSEKSTKYFCLIIRDQGNDVFLMPSAQCNEELERNVITGKTKPLARVTIMKEKDQCFQPNTTASPPITITTTSSTNHTSTGTATTGNYTSTAHTGTATTSNYTSATGTATSTAHTGTATTAFTNHTASTRNYTSHTKSSPTGTTVPFTGTTSSTTGHPLTTAVPGPKGLTPGQIAGIVIGVLLALILLVVIIIFIYKKCSPRSSGYESM